MTDAPQLARDALQALYTEVDRNTCRHESTHRGGAIWTICDDCGRKWSDDRDPYKPWKQPALWGQVESAIAAFDAAIAQRGEPVALTSAVPGSAGGFTMAVFAASDVPIGAPLYTAPPAPRVPLTDEQIDNVCALLGFAQLSPREVARAIERAHGIGA